MQEREEVKKNTRRKLRAINKVSNAVDVLILMGSILILILGIYALWDSHKVCQIADSEEYAMYKPDKSDDLLYKKLREINPDVIGWIDVYGTKIDYPIVQSKENGEYLNKTVLGEFSTGGSIFLDSRNNKTLSDFNNILYGHYMAERKMFGDIELFKKKDFFNSHKYAAIYRNNLPPIGVTFFALVKGEGSDSKIFDTTINDKDQKSQLISYLYSKAVFSRKINISDEDRIVLLDTCDLSVTNGRHILVGKITDKVHKNTFKNEKQTNKFAKLLSMKLSINLLLLLVIVLLILVLAYTFLEQHRKRKADKERGDLAK